MRFFIFILLCSSISFGEIVKIENSGFSMPQINLHDKTVKPNNWSLKLEKTGHCKTWITPFQGKSAINLKNGSIHQTVSAPELGTDNRKADVKDFHAIVSFDLLGYSESKQSKFAFKVTSPNGKNTFTKIISTPKSPAPTDPRLDWKIVSSSADAGGKDPNNVLDGDSSTYWETKNKKGAMISVAMPEKTGIYGFKFQDLSFKNRTGKVKDYEIFVSSSSTSWPTKPTYRGSFNYTNICQTVLFPRPLIGKFIKIVALSSFDNKDTLTISRFEPLTKSNKSDKTPLKYRFYQTIPTETLLNNRKFKISFSTRGKGGVIIDNISMIYTPKLPTAKMCGSPNKEAGPDQVAAGFLGFTGYSEHKVNLLPIMKVYDQSLAYNYGIKQGDILVGVNDEAFSPTSCNPGWDWLENGHEPTIGRALLTAIQKRKPLTCNIFKPSTNKVERLKVELHLAGKFYPYFPLKMGPLGNRIYNDIINFIATRQKSDGSFLEEFGGRPSITTSLSAMALLGTKDKKYLSQVRKAVYWVLEKQGNPEKQGFWDLSYNGILLCEWYFATGDKKVLPWIKDALNWLPTVMHKCKWGMKIWGHGAGGIPYGEKSLIAPTAHLMVFGALANRACKLKNKLWQLGEPYIVHTWSDIDNGGHGAMGYNASLKDTGQAWSRTGNIATAVKILNIREDFQRGFTSYHQRYFPVMRNSHAYGYPGAQWGLVGLFNMDYKLFSQVMKEWQWDFILAWQPGFGLRFSQPHMGAPYMGNEAIVNPAYGFLLSVKNRGLYMTGNRQRNWAK